MKGKFRIVGEAANIDFQSGVIDTPGSTADLIFTGIDGSPELARITAEGEFSVGGEPSPVGPFHLVSNPIVLAIDQSTFNTSVAGTDTYQSFIAISTGYLAKVSLRATTTPYSGILEIRSGIGIGGTLLASASITLAVDTIVDIPISCYLINTNQYSLVVTGSSTLSASNTDPYADGDSSVGSTDLFFRVYTKSLNAPPDVFTVKNDGSEINKVLKQNNLLTRRINQEFSSLQEIEIESGVGGIGTVHVGDDWGYAKFVWDSSGNVTLIENTNTVVDSDTADVFCIYDKGTNIALKNGLAVPISVKTSLHYSIISSGGAAAPTTP